MARRVYTPRSRPNRGAQIRVGYAELEDHRDRPLGSHLLRKYVGPDSTEANGDPARGILGSIHGITQRSSDACGAIGARRGSFISAAHSARLNTWGRDGAAHEQWNQTWVYDRFVGGEQPPSPPVPPVVQMRFISVAPDIATPGDQAIVVGENVFNMMTVTFHATPWTDGFGKRHVIIDGVEYIEI
jgi:hypothetical protein